MIKPPPRAFRSLLVAGIALVVVSCGGANSREVALDALERTTAASELEAQMAGLVESTGLAITPAQGKKLGSEIDRIDGEAETILSASSSDAEFDRSIDTSVNQTREAGSQMAVAVGQPAELLSARKKASARLVKSNKNLKTATSEIGTELADDDGNLSEQDAAALGQTVASVEDSGEAVNEAAESAACSVPGKDGGAFQIEVAKGDIGCAKAAAVMEKSEDPAVLSAPGGNSSQGLVFFDGWFCASPLGSEYASIGPGDSVRYCEREADGTLIEKRLPK